MSAASELRSIRKGLDKLREEMRALVEAQAVGQPHAVKRIVAAKLMGVGVTKLDGLIRSGKVKTADDVTLVPMSEVRRYCAPKAKRERKPAVGVRAMRRADGQSDDAIAAARALIRSKARSA